LAILVVDNLSPYTQYILYCMKTLGATYVYKKFYELTGRSSVQYEKVILSGRSKNRRDINVTNSKIIQHCYLSDIPVLGICYGAEIMALTLGGSISRMHAPVQGMVTVSVSELSDDSFLVPDKKSLYVYESHGYCVARIPEGFISIASSKFCKHEIFIHQKKRLIGVQFHPEKSNNDGLVLLSNFIRT
jgi:GMP synthase (glutamine-hydrolysing)